MPIDYKKYDRDWFTIIRPAILARANNQCECCGLENKAEGIRALDGTFYNIWYILSELENCPLVPIDIKIIVTSLVIG